MKIDFVLGWTKKKPSARDYKFEENYKLFSEYLGRISHFVPCESSGIGRLKERKPGSRLWCCHMGKNAKALSSADVAAQLKKIQMNATKELLIAIGPADGFSQEDIQMMNADLLWSFGPLTLPHELASVVAAEQLYRAFSILQGLPYHHG